MTPSGPKHERETVITFNEADDLASIWTASASVHQRLARAGYVEVSEGGRHVEFRVPKRDIRLPKPRRAMSQGQREALEKARLARAGLVAAEVEAPYGLGTRSGANRG